MVKSFLICEAIRFNEVKDYFIPVQLELESISNEGVAENRIQKKTEDFHSGYDQYLCYYYYVHNKPGFVFGQDFQYYYEPMEFHTYYNSGLNAVFIQNRTDVAIEFKKDLNKTKEYNLNIVSMNFEKMIPLITEVAGAWIADLNRAHLKTAGFFGPDVHKSEEYIEAAREGNISSIMMKYISNNTGIEHTVNISKKGSITIYDKLNTIEEEVSLVQEIYLKLIKPHL